MKTILYTLAILSISLVTLAGPSDKNYKPWKHKKNFSEVAASKEVEKKNGPQAKNEKAWEKNEETISLETGNRMNLKGPQAKNYKPWRK